MRRKGAMLIILVTFAFIFAGTVAAHPGHDGHGSSEEVIVDPGPGGSTGTETGSTGTGTGSTGTKSSDTGTSSSAPTSSASKSAGNTQSTQTGINDGQTTGKDNSNATTDTGSSPDVTTGNSGSAGITQGAIVAIIGLIVVLTLIAMNFPYKKGGAVNRFKTRLFGG